MAIIPNTYYALHLEIEEPGFDLPVEGPFLSIRVQTRQCDESEHPRNTEPSEHVLVIPRSKESAKMFFEIAERVKELAE